MHLVCGKKEGLLWVAELAYNLSIIAALTLIFVCEAQVAFDFFASRKDVDKSHLSESNGSGIENSC